MDYYYPSFLPAEMRANMVWLTLKPKKVIRVNSNPKTKEGSVGTKIPTDMTRFESIGDTYHFLMPDEISLSISHTWKDFASVIGVGREILAEATKQWGSSVEPIKKVIKSQKGLDNIANGIANLKFDALELGQKNDNPIAYENSTRKTISFEIELSTYTNSKSDVFDPIQRLLNLSSANMLSTVIHFEFPYVFEITTTVGGLESSFVHMKNGAITSLNPEFRAPYIDGYASSATMIIQFEDMDPLWRSEAWDDRVTIKSMTPTVPPPYNRNVGIEARNTQLLSKSKSYLDLYMAKINGVNGFTLDTNIGDVNIGVGPGHIEMENIPYYLSPTSLLNPRIS